MSNYTKTTNFGAKDGLTTGDSNKLVKGSEFDTEFDAIATAVSTKADAQVDFQITDTVGFTIDPANGGIQYVTLGANRTPVWGGSDGEGMLLMVDDGTAYSITWTHSTFNSGSGPTWLNNGGSAPSLATSGYTAITLFQMNSVVYGALVGNGT